MQIYNFLKFFYIFFKTSQVIADAEKEKFSKEYEGYKEKLEKQKEEYVFIL